MWDSHAICRWPPRRLADLARRACVGLGVVIFLLFEALAAEPGAAQPPATAEPLRIGLIPERNIFEQVGHFEPLRDLLSRRLGRPVELTTLGNYCDIIQRVRANDLDAAFLGSFTGALAISELDMEPLARPLRPDGTSTYVGHIFVRSDSGLERAADMRGKRLALVDRATTAGFAFPVAYFRRHGIDDFDAFFAEVQFWGSHDAAIEAVINGKADVGAAKSTLFDALARREPRPDDELSILASSTQVPSNALFVTAEMDPALKERIRRILVSLHHAPRDDEALEALGATGFVTTNAEDYDSVSALAEEAGLALDASTCQAQ